MGKKIGERPPVDINLRRPGEIGRAKPLIGKIIPGKEGPFDYLSETEGKKLPAVPRPILLMKTLIVVYKTPGISIMSKIKWKSAY